LEADQAPTDVEQAPAPAVAVPAAEHSGQPERGRLGGVAHYQASLSDIPAASLRAYQRAEAVMGEAAARCGLDWTVLAGVAEVESDHGRADDNRVTAGGASRPGVFGKPLNGKHGRARMRDTDAGLVDGNTRWDAPAGPMSLLPATWSAVGVDGDGDGSRDPQDVDDAALGVAVLLCDGARDLSGRKEQRMALAAFNPTPGYARLVMSLAKSYRNDYVPTPTVALTPAELPDLPSGPLPADNGAPGEGSPAGAPTRDPGVLAAEGPTGPRPSNSPGQSSPSTTPSTSPSSSPSTGPSTEPSSSGLSSPKESPRDEPTAITTP